MACENRLWLMVLLLLAATCMQHCVHGQQQVPCLFIFGDSLSDSGNNNRLATFAKANYPPYAIDSSIGPTGRFTNGRNAIDYITQFLGFANLIPPFASSSGFDILKGVNYASGSAGIHNETGTHLGDNVSLEKQLANHRVIVSKIATILGGLDQALQCLNQCLYYVNIGSNDYINNYFMTEHYPTSRAYNFLQYAEVLIQHYSQAIMALHNELGARKLVLNGLGHIGCSPFEISNNGIFGLCVAHQNFAVALFNNNLRSLVRQLNEDLSDAQFIYVDNVAISTQYPLSGGTKKLLLTSPMFFTFIDNGFLEFNIACCPVRGDGQCIPNQTPCQNRNQYVFYDGFHTTEPANLITAISSYNASNPFFTYPIDINHLVNSAY